MNKCAECGRSMVNVGIGLECENARCLKSKHSRGVMCDHPGCGKPPGEITNAGSGFIDYLCVDGHQFMMKVGRV